MKQTKANKNEIITKIFKSQEYDDLLKKLIERSDLYLDDFKQDLMIILLEKDSKLIEDLWESNNMKFYIIRIVLNQIYSNTSPFYVQHKKYHRELVQINYELIDQILIEDLEEDLAFLDDLDKLINNNILSFINKNSILTWYETNILSIYYSLGEYKDNKDKVSLRTMEKKYGIHYVSLHLTIKESIDKIKTFIKDELKKQNKIKHTYN